MQLLVTTLTIHGGVIIVQKVYYKEKTSHVALRMPESIADWLADIAHDSRRSRGAQIVKMIEDHPDYQAHFGGIDGSLQRTA